MASAPSVWAAQARDSPGTTAPLSLRSPSCDSRTNPQPDRTAWLTAGAHTHTSVHTRVHTPPHHLPFPLEAAQATQEPRSFIRASIIGKRQQHRGGEALEPRRRLCLPHCPRLCPGRAPATTAGKAEKPQKPQPRTRTAPAAQLPPPWGRSGKAARKLSSSYPLPRGNQPETRVNRKAKKSPGEGGLPVGGRGRLEDRGESEEACLSWRQGGSPS